MSQIALTFTKIILHSNGLQVKKITISSLYLMLLTKTKPRLFVTIFSPKTSNNMLDSKILDDFYLQRCWEVELIQHLLRAGLCARRLTWWFHWPQHCSARKWVPGPPSQCRADSHAGRPHEGPWQVPSQAPSPSTGRETMHNPLSWITPSSDKLGYLHLNFSFPCDISIQDFTSWINKWLK